MKLADLLDRSGLDVPDRQLTVPVIDSLQAQGDLIVLPLANASLLDEATAAAEAMAMCWSIGEHKSGTFIVADDCHPQTIAVVQTRARSMGMNLVVGNVEEITKHKLQITNDVCGVLVQYPSTDGRIVDYTDLVNQAHVYSLMLRGSLYADVHL